MNSFGFSVLALFEVCLHTSFPWELPWAAVVRHSRARHCHFRVAWWICSTLSANVQALNFLLKMGDRGYRQHYQNLGLRASSKAHWDGCWDLFNACTSLFNILHCNYLKYKFTFPFSSTTKEFVRWTGWGRWQSLMWQKLKPLRGPLHS